jgi:hypothetical protein
MRPLRLRIWDLDRAAMKSLLKKDSNLSIENRSFKGFALSSTR